MDTNIQSSEGSAKRSDYRHHTKEFKRALVMQTWTSSSSVSVIARKHDVNANQLFAWRKLFKEGKLGTPASTECKLLPVTIAELPRPKPMRSPEMTTASAGVIQLEVGKARLRIEGAADASTLSLIIEQLLR